MDPAFAAITGSKALDVFTGSDDFSMIHLERLAYLATVPPRSQCSADLLHASYPHP